MRLPGLEDRSPRRALLTRGERRRGLDAARQPRGDLSASTTSTICSSRAAPATASAFLAADLVDRLLIYRAPILIGEGKSAVGYIGLDSLADAHRRWRLADTRALGIDRLEVYERLR